MLIRMLTMLMIVVEIESHSEANDRVVFSSNEDQVKYMRRCVELAKEAVKNGQAPYGALIVDPRNRTILSEGLNHASQNPLWHGEMDAINKLSFNVKSVYEVAPYLELYTSAEPCPMCMSAILWSGFGRVYYGTSITYLEEQKLDQIDIRSQYVANAATSFRKVEIVGGLLSNETNPLYDKNRSHYFHDHHHHHNHDHHHHHHHHHYHHHHHPHDDQHHDHQ